MKKRTLLFLIVCHFVWAASAQIPAVYSEEHTGSSYPLPPLPAASQLPDIEPLTDPFEWSDGSGRSTYFSDWSHRRAEIKAEIEHYEIGEKPVRPDTLEASYSGNTLTVHVTVNGNTLTLTSEVSLPSGPGPFPAIIGMGAPTGSLPTGIFIDRDIAQITFNFDQVMAHTQSRGNEPINQLYPSLTHIGAYSAWSWGVSRLIDGLELVSSDLPIDLSHLAVSGCSFAGKMALFAGAFDERIALTIAQESGGGGAAAWRVSETLGAVETLGATNSAWFRSNFIPQFGNEVPKLPFDHHELMAMVAPRALLVLGNPDYVWLADESGYVSCRAAHRVWEAFGVPERFGFSIVGGHNHCALPAVQSPEVEAFVDAFLLGDSTANTQATVHPFGSVNYERWTEWWGSGNPVFPVADTAGSQFLFYEPECADIGSNWHVIASPDASNERYVTVNPALESVASASQASEDHISISFTVEKDTTYYVFGLMDCPSADDDSYWIRIDNGPFELANGLGTSGWEWVRINPSNYELTAGSHTLTIAYRENGANLDKICISDCAYPPAGIGRESQNLCSVFPTNINVPKEANRGFGLRQYFPNPATDQTIISFEITQPAIVSLKVLSVLGKEIRELAGESWPLGSTPSNGVARTCHRECISTNSKP